MLQIATCNSSLRDFPFLVSRKIFLGETKIRKFPHCDSPQIAQYELSNETLFTNKFEI